MNELRERAVVVVEDSDEDWDTACLAARPGGFEHRLIRAPDGDTCLALLRAGHAPHKAAALAPALLLLDLSLPGQDGRQVLLQIKHDAGLAALPVVVLTTSSNPRDVQACYAAGANAYHVKPLRHSDHLALLRGLFTYWLVDAVLPEMSQDLR